MLLVRGTAEGATLTGTIYERGEDAPTFDGAPDEGAPYVFVCDEFYEVASGGQVQKLGDREVRVAFDAPLARGFETRTEAVEAAREHVATQFSRVGVDPATVRISVVPEYEA